MRQKRNGRKIPPDDTVEGMPREHLSIPGSIQFPSVSRSNSKSPRPPTSEFSMKFFSTPTSSGAGLRGNLLSTFRSSSDSAWSFGAFPNKSASTRPPASTTNPIPVPTFRTPTLTPRSEQNSPALSTTKYVVEKLKISSVVHWCSSFPLPLGTHPSVPRRAMVSFSLLLISPLPQGPQNRELQNPHRAISVIPVTRSSLVCIITIGIETLYFSQVLDQVTS